MLSNIVTTDMFADVKAPVDVQVGSLLYEDVGAAILYYPNMIATLDLTAWEATGWVEGWRMEYYGTNGTLIVHPFPSKLHLWLRSERAGFEKGETVIAYPTEPANSILYDTYRTQLFTLINKLRRHLEPTQEALLAGQTIVRILDQIYNEGS